jgi:2-phospho-L-lactate guanylyltransferase
MCLWSIVPVKPSRRAIALLSDILSSEEREQLFYGMLKNTLKALNSAPEIGKVLVVSSDMSALALARDYHARTLLEDKQTELNTALTRATTLAKAYAASGILIMAADMPFITAKDIQSFLAHSSQAPEVMIAPDRHGAGTNCLFMRPAGLIPYAYGANSFQHHLDHAKQAGASVEIYRSPAFEFDMDTPADYQLYRQILSGNDQGAESPTEPFPFMEAK